MSIPIKNLIKIVLFVFFFSFLHTGTADAAFLDLVIRDTHIYGDYTYGIHEDGTAIILGYTGNERVVRIPSEIDALPVHYVWGLGEYCPMDETASSYMNDKTKKIIVPDGVVSVAYLRGHRSGCNNVEQIILPDSVTKIYDYTFEYCEKLNYIRMSKNIKDVGENAFYGCKQLQTIEFSEGLETIGKYAFGHCSSLKSVVLPDTVKIIGEGAFLHCRELRDVRLPSQLTIIDSYTFNSCQKLKKITIPDSVKIIRKRAFQSTGLRQVTIPENVTKIGIQSFANNGKLKKVVIKSKKINIFGEAIFVKRTKANLIVDVPDTCIRKYKKMLRKKNSLQKYVKVI